MLPVYLPRLKAPRTHGEFLVHPPLDAVEELLRDNRASLVGASLLGRPLAQLREAAGREALEAARTYLSRAGEPVPEFSSSSLLVAGHQPELFHPGVWVKNFILQSLARRHGATPLNLVVDNDVAKAATLRLPSGERVTTVPFDAGGGEIPFEERTVADEALFQSLPERIRPMTKDWPFRPWIDGVWAELRRVAPATSLLGERIVRARRALERSMGLAPLEVPLSAVCGTESFAWFACAILAELPRFVDDYNAAVGDYRRRHGLKSKNHPVPDLAIVGEAHETPFWVWRVGTPRRQRLFAARDRRGLQLLAGTTPLFHLEGSAESWAAPWRALEGQGIKIRTRALTTTLYSRLLLGDLFIHGIGGGKYDEVTDAIIARHFNLRPPHYLVATATLLLPFARELNVEGRLHAAQRIKRDLWYNPQRHLDGDLPNDGDAGLTAKKRDARAMPETTHQERVARFQALLRATSELRPLVAGQVERAEAAVRNLQHAIGRDAIATSRNYSFCLYPEDMLRAYLNSDGVTQQRPGSRP